jgi:hypothetical protein
MLRAERRLGRELVGSAAAVWEEVGEILGRLAAAELWGPVVE